MAVLDPDRPAAAAAPAALRAGVPGGGRLVWGLVALAVVADLLYGVT